MRDRLVWSAPGRISVARQKNYFSCLAAIDAQISARIIRDMNTAKNIRAALKSELGLSAKQVSVTTSTTGSVRVVIKDRWVSKKKVAPIAERFESVSRCSATGEILQGGNTFVFVSYASGLFDEERALVASLLPKGDEVVTISQLRVNRCNDGQLVAWNDAGHVFSTPFDECAARMLVEYAVEAA